MYTSKSLNEVADALAVDEGRKLSVERIRQIEKVALGKFKQGLLNHGYDESVVKDLLSPSPPPVTFPLSAKSILRHHLFHYRLVILSCT